MNILYDPLALEGVLARLPAAVIVGPAAEAVAQAQRDRVRVRSGRLHRSIEISFHHLGATDVPVADVGPDAKSGFYGWMVENGTQRSRPFPFVRPSADVLK